MSRDPSTSSACRGRAAYAGGLKSAFVSIGMVATCAPAMTASTCGDDADTARITWVDDESNFSSRVAFDAAARAEQSPAEGAGAGGPTGPHRRELEDERPFHEVSFAATHNSYAGPLSGGDVASLPAQLDVGVRFLELDVHDDDYARSGYRVGHERPGDLVFHGGGNPRTDALEDWLRLIATWSDTHRDHAPITICLDLKDALAENPSFDQGDLGALNRLLEDTFREKLFTAEERETRPWPSVSELRGRILIVLSGDEETRIAYRGDHGESPSIALDDRGRVIEAHDSGGGELWYWAGDYGQNNQVTWRRHGFYDTGKNPSIDINNHGLVVEVHEDPDLGDDQLWYRVGRLRSNFEIAWLHERGLAFPGAGRGRDPVVRFVDRDRAEVQEVHRAPWSRRRLMRTGMLDASRSMIAWSEEVRDAPADGLPSPKSLASSTRGTIEAFADEDGAFGNDTLLFSTDRSGPTRIRFRQVAFVEYQHGSPSQLSNDGLLFYAGPAGELSARTWASAWRAAGKVARLWRFNDARLTRESSVNFPATDLPLSGWYRGYRRALAFVR